jgi:hypothetical protein
MKSWLSSMSGCRLIRPYVSNKNGPANLFFPQKRKAILSNREKMKKRILCVGLTCLDIVTEVAAFPKEDTDQRSAGMSWRRGGNARLYHL